MKSNTPAGATILALVILSLLLTISTPFIHRVLLFKLFCAHRAVWHEQQWATIALARLACKSAAKNWDIFAAHKNPIIMEFAAGKVFPKSELVVKIMPQSQALEIVASVINPNYTTSVCALLSKKDNQILISQWQTIPSSVQ